jgi:hypothetical protein
VQDEGPVQVMLNENIGYARANLHGGEYDKAMVFVDLGHALPMLNDHIGHALTMLYDYV